MDVSKMSAMRFINTKLMILILYRKKSGSNFKTMRTID
jgi:hypothetical protein